MDFYVYYKVQPEHAAGLQRRVIAMQADIASAYGVIPQLKRRPVPPGDVQTWMEVYPAVAQTAHADFASGLETAVTRAGLAHWISGPRHVEIFEDFAPCA